jgi:hypothetical protein
MAQLSTHIGRKEGTFFVSRRIANSTGFWSFAQCARSRLFGESFTELKRHGETYPCIRASIGHLQNRWWYNRVSECFAVMRFMLNTKGLRCGFAQGVS